MALVCQTQAQDWLGLNIYWMLTQLCSDFYNQWLARCETSQDEDVEIVSDYTFHGLFVVLQNITSNILSSLCLCLFIYFSILDYKSLFSRSIVPIQLWAAIPPNKYDLPVAPVGSLSSLSSDWWSGRYTSIQNKQSYFPFKKVTVASQRWRSWAADGSGGIPQLFFVVVPELSVPCPTLLFRLCSAACPQERHNTSGTSPFRVCHTGGGRQRAFLGGRKTYERKKKKKKETCGTMPERLHPSLSPEFS